ncbi:hypothetical protein [Flavobacterium caseinilyticum]|uniref:Uncharacterized protein n=1 Tax=Flavobacterium caseinilyticum TaxID=2541732 RepID=A0A4R5AR12_9FLAO|nr:hypothetical protein [Flavobacterium caseinilyticum]TDD75143.1 hypothetical protein E0F89_12210 [Flavobacterium caseinilyticum]
MEIITKNNRTLLFRELTDENLWESKLENTSSIGSTKSNYQFSFKNDLIKKEYIIENYDFNSYLKSFINYFIENEIKISKTTRKVIDDISNINDDEKFILNEENSFLHYVRILDIVNYSFKVHIVTNYGYENYIITYLLYDNGNLTITKIKRKLCY